MSFRERALTFDCQGDTLVGLVSQPDGPTRRGVVIVVGGPQYRAGSHRQFVSTARALAAAGLAVLRFDVRGMGDSTGDLRNFEAIDADIGAAIDALQRAVPSVEQVLLLGLCDGASASLMYMDLHRDDSRIAGLALINPWVRSAETLAKAHVKHYYLQRLRDGEFWRKLLRGKVAWGALRGLVTNLALALGPGRKAEAGDQRGFQQRMADGWVATSVPIWLVLSGDDYTAKEFITAWDSDPIWRAAHARPGVQRFDMDGADHTFSAISDQRSLDGLLQQALARDA